MPSFPGFDWAQQGVSSRFFPGKCKVIHGEVWVKNSEWSCRISLKLHCLVAWPLSSVLAPAAFFFSQTFPLIQPSLACFFFMPMAPSPRTPEVYNSMWESSVERRELIINETNSDISLPECVVCVCIHEFLTLKYPASNSSLCLPQPTPEVVSDWPIVNAFFCSFQLATNATDKTHCSWGSRAGCVCLIQRCKATGMKELTDLLPPSCLSPTSHSCPLSNSSVSANQEIFLCSEIFPEMPTAFYPKPHPEQI